jgi:hypothetical protein
MRYDEEEPQRFLGIPIVRAQQDAGRGDRDDSGRAGRHSMRGGRYDTRPRVLGIPTSGFAVRPMDLRWLRHPVRWRRWRREVRRLGPYARRFEDIS